MQNAHHNRAAAEMWPPCHHSDVRRAKLLIAVRTADYPGVSTFANHHLIQIRVAARGGCLMKLAFALALARTG